MVIMALKRKIVEKSSSPEREKITGLGENSHSNAMKGIT